MTDFILYGYWRSSASYRVRIALNLKSVAYEYRAVHLVNGGGEHKRGEYLALNPSAEVPTLVHQGRPIAQSIAIMQYLDDVLSNGLRLFPDPPYDRARVMQACEIVNSGIQPVGNLKVLQELEKRFGADSEAKRAWSAYWIDLGLRAFEKIIAPSAGAFCFGDAPGAADACLAPQAYNALRNGLALDEYPKLANIYKNCLARPEFQRARPEAQPDAPSAPAATAN